MGIVWYSLKVDCKPVVPEYLWKHVDWMLKFRFQQRRFPTNVRGTRTQEVLSIKDLKKNQSLAMHKVSIRKALVDATQKLPEPVTRRQ